MIVECTATELTPEQKTRLGTAFPREQARLLKKGIRYPVLGLQYDVGSILWGTGAWVQLPVAADRMVIAPLYLFEVVDGRPSRHWEIKLWEDGAITLWPFSFYKPYYHGDLEAGVPEVVEDFASVVEEVLAEIDSEQRKRTTFVQWPAPTSGAPR